MNKKIIKSISLILVFCISVAFCFGCNKSTSTSPLDGVIGERKVANSSRKSFSLFGSSSKSSDGIDDIALADADYAESFEGIPSDSFPGGEQIEAKAGTLTAGEWKDRENLEDWLIKITYPEWVEELSSRGLYSNNIFPVHVTSNDNDIYNIKVSLMDNKNKELYSARTDVKGMAYLFCPDSKLDDIDSFLVGTERMFISKDDLGLVNEIKCNEGSVVLKELDLMLMVDTTGSMGDELQYLQKELTDVVERVAKNNVDNKALSIRVSVNFYRDDGDEYIVKYFDFRDDVQEAVKLIEEQEAMGGGDYPEAVHTALDNAVNGHQWRENAVKLCFLVLDAPPHDASEIQDVNVSILKSINSAAEKGIRIIPVASSGVDRETEVDCRSFAIMTGGTYVFLTDDSGVGNDHLEADVGDFTVEPLNDCMVRIICEYCGTEEIRNEPETTEIVSEESTTQNPNYPDVSEYELLTESNTSPYEVVEN